MAWLDAHFKVTQEQARTCQESRPDEYTVVYDMAWVGIIDTSLSADAFSQGFRRRKAEKPYDSRTGRP